MSKEGYSLRLLGSPVNLSYRCKKKDKSHVRNRPRSALQNSCFAPDDQERSKRPFSADTKDSRQLSSVNYSSFAPGLSSPTYDRKSIESALTIRVLAPTTELLENKEILNGNKSIPHDICSNSDYGSEDTFISLGTKIKAKAQQITKKKLASNKSNFLKYRNCGKRAKKTMDENKNEEDKSGDSYGMEVNITERQSLPRNRDLFYERPLSPSIRRSTYEAYFSSLEETKRIVNENFLVKYSAGTSKIETDVVSALETYSRRLQPSKQQLSLVEEESTQDLDSVHSLNLQSLSYENVENCSGDSKKDTETGNLTGRNTYTVDKEEEQRDINDLRTYNNFYDDFRALSNSRPQNKCKLSSSAVNTDTSSKDSGYNDIGSNDEKRCISNNSIEVSSSSATCYAKDKVKEPMNNDRSIAKTKSDSTYNTFPLDKNHWTEPTNHSRLLYKDFYLKKEGGTTMPPQNSPRTGSLPNVSEATNDNEENVEYPRYLQNSTTKAYTSKVIEDYKKELEAINSLHELTLKDIKTDTISPTPLNIDKMFEVNSVEFDSTSSSDQSVDKKAINNNKKGKHSSDSTKKDVSHISTKELIQNYFKVKEEYSREYPNKNNKNVGKQSNTNSIAYKPANLNNKTPRTTSKTPLSVSVRNATFRNSAATMPPSSARLEKVQHDKDIESWMSLTSPSPHLLDVEIEEIKEVVNTNETPNSKEKTNNKDETKTEIKFIDSPAPNTSDEKVSQKCHDLSENSTVLDIYTMLKEIESFGENPVTKAQIDIKSTGDSMVIHETEERQSTSPPRDNFMEIFQFLEKVEQSANDALSVVTTTTPQTIPKLEALLKLPQTELAQQLVTASLQLEERSCCIALLQESLSNHKEQMINKLSNLEKQSMRNITRVKQECEATIKRHQSFIDQLINDKKTLNHRIEQLVDERRTLEERWKRSAQALEERYKLELRNQHDKMVAAQQVARQRWVRQKAEKIKELTVKGLESELREMAERQQKDVADLKMQHAEVVGRMQSKHAAELEQLRRTLEQEKEEALIKERQLASARLEKQILELEMTYQEQRTRLVADMRAENERANAELSRKEQDMKQQIEAFREEQEKLIAEKKEKLEQEIEIEKGKIEEKLKQKEKELELQFEQFKKTFEAEQQMQLKKKLSEVTAQHKLERDKEIEKAIEMMEAEAQNGKKELQEAMRRNKEQYETELQELAETEKATLRRYQEAHARIRLTEDKCAELETTINQLQTRNKVLTEKVTELESHGREIKERCEESWRHIVEGLKKEMVDMKKTHEEQMHQIYAKVKVAVARKDSAIQALTRESAKYQEKIAVLEQKLQQQRKDFLKHK